MPSFTLAIFSVCAGLEHFPFFIYIWSEQGKGFWSQHESFRRGDFVYGWANLSEHLPNSSYGPSILSGVAQLLYLFE